MGEGEFWGGVTAWTQWVWRRVEARHVLVLLAVLVYPWVATPFFTFQIGAQSLALGLIALSLTFLAGYGGMVSLAQMTVAGIAGYMYAIFATSGTDISLRWPWGLAVVLALVIATACGTLIGWFSVRTEGIYTIMITLAIGVAFYYLAQQNYSLFNGFQGFQSVMTPAVGGAEATGATAVEILLDGFRIVVDLVKSRGCRLVDAVTGRELLDLYGFYGALPVGFNHPWFARPEVRADLLQAASTKVANSDVLSVPYATFVGTFSRVMGRTVKFRRLPLSLTRVVLGKEFYEMFKWFNEAGFEADIPALRRDYPEVAWTSLEQWLTREGWVGKNVYTRHSKMFDAKIPKAA